MADQWYYAHLQRRISDIQQLFLEVQKEVNDAESIEDVIATEDTLVSYMHINKYTNKPPQYLKVIKSVMLPKTFNTSCSASELQDAIAKSLGVDAEKVTSLLKRDEEEGDDVLCVDFRKSEPRVLHGLPVGNMSGMYPRLTVMLEPGTVYPYDTLMRIDRNNFVNFLESRLKYAAADFRELGADNPMFPCMSSVHIASDKEAAIQADWDAYYVFVKTFRVFP
jgi:hypothetical protein